MGRLTLFTLMVLMVLMTTSFTRVTGDPIDISSSYCDRTLQDDYDTISVYCHGSEFDNKTATMEWSLDTNSGQRLVLATCYGVSNCTSAYNSSVLGVVRGIRYGLYASTSLSIPKIGRQFSGTLKCTETLTDGTTNSTTCRLNVKRVYISTEVNAVRDGSTLSNARCDFPGKLTPSVVSWTLSTTSGQTLDLGSCYAAGNCTSSDLSRPTGSGDYLYSYATVRGITRDKAGTLTCSFSYQGVVNSGSAEIQVYSVNPRIENCTAVMQRENWTLALSCDVDQLFSTSGVYQIDVDNSREMLERRSLSNYLTAYTDGTGKVFYRGTVFYFWKLPAVPKEYLYFKVNIYSGVGLDSSLISSPESVAPPGTPVINCNGFTNYIPENTTCVCTVDNLGSPEGRLRWLLGDAVVATGPYGVKSLELPPEKSTRLQDGLTFFCQVDWIQHQTMSIVMLVENAGADDAELKWITVALGAVLAVLVVVIIVLVTIKCRKNGTPRQYDRTTRPSTVQDASYYLDLRTRNGAQTEETRHERAGTNADRRDGRDRVYQNTGFEGKEDDVDPYDNI